MPARLLALVAAAALAASAVVVASAQTPRSGLPAYTKGWEKWPRINKKPIRNEDPRSGHPGTKHVHVNKRKVGSKYPNGTVVVKAIVEARTRYVGKIAVMRKVAGRWQYVEYTRTGPKARYTILAQGRLCQSCHAQARANDYVFTKR
jgi:hypothetical protein